MNSRLMAIATRKLPFESGDPHRPVLEAPALNALVDRGRIELEP